MKGFIKFVKDIISAGGPKGYAKQQVKANAKTGAKYASIFVLIMTALFATVFGAGVLVGRTSVEGTEAPEGEEETGDGEEGEEQ